VRALHGPRRRAPATGRGSCASCASVRACASRRVRGVRRAMRARRPVQGDQGGGGVPPGARARAAEAARIATASVSTARPSISSSRRSCSGMRVRRPLMRLRLRGARGADHACTSPARRSARAPRVMRRTSARAPCCPLACRVMRACITRGAPTREAARPPGLPPARAVLLL
jgi:hypothetical protein